MQPIVVAQPYEFVPPHRGPVWPALLRPLMLGRFLRSFGIERVDCRGTERLRASLAAGHGIVLAPNHSRPPDPFVVSALGRDAGCQLFIMASWHLFMQGRMQRFLLPRAGVFSIYREGLDREAIKCAIQILGEARRPLVVFPEGTISRHNDRLSPMMDGLALIARSAAKQRAAAGRGPVVVHPVAIRYLFEGDADAAIRPMLDDLERRLTWEPARTKPAPERIIAIGGALLALKEVEYLGAPQPGGLGERVERLIDRLLRPLEEEWLKGRREKDVIGRAKSLRTAILPDMVAAKLDAAETDRRWRQLRDVYLAQQLSLYPADYLAGTPPPERIIELAEKLEEDLTDAVRRLAPFRTIVDVGEAIDVPPDRPRGGDGDPLVPRIRDRISAMLAASLAEHRPGAVIS